MRATLLILTEELRRLQTAGVKTVPVDESTLLALRRVVAARAAAAGPTPDADVVAATAPAPRHESVDTETAARPAPVRALPARAPAEPALPPPPRVALPDGTKAERWQALLQAVTDDPVCRAAVRPGKQVVLGTGNLDAKIFFCGEAPGAEEEVQGEPFVGPAGQLLTKMIQAMGLKRGDVYIGNIMNWRPQMPTPEGQEQVGNRPPSNEELSYCLPYLRAQVGIVQPQVVVALGATAARGLLGVDSFKTLGEIRGRWSDFAGTPVMVTYHPSYILRNQSNRSKRVIWEDLLQVMERTGLAISEKQRGFFLDR